MNTELPVIRVTRAGTGSQLPGDLLAPATGIGQCEVKTTVRASWTDAELIVRFSCEDTDIWGTHLERDAPLYDEEVVEVFLSPSGDVRHYFELEVSPRNVVFDATIHSPDLDRRTMIVDAAWDCAGLRSNVKTGGPVHLSPPINRPPNPGWWRAEVGIPFAGLGVEPPKPGDVWRGNFYRIDRPAGPAPVEYQAWSPTLKVPANFHVPARFGRLVFER